MGSQVFWRRALSEPGWIAAVEPDGTAHTAGDLLARVNQLTHGLRERGLRPGDGLAVLVPNGIAALEVYLAALQSGFQEMLKDEAYLAGAEKLKQSIDPLSAAETRTFVG